MLNVNIYSGLLTFLLLLLVICAFKVKGQRITVIDGN